MWICKEMPRSDKKHMQVKNPATGEVIATVPCMKANETSAAVAEATSAWPEWSKKIAKERSKIMRKQVFTPARY